MRLLFGPTDKHEHVILFRSTDEHELVRWPFGLADKDERVILSRGTDEHELVRLPFGATDKHKHVLLFRSSDEHDLVGLLFGPIDKHQHVILFRSRSRTAPHPTSKNPDLISHLSESDRCEIQVWIFLMHILLPTLIFALPRAVGIQREGASDQD